MKRLLYLLLTFIILLGLTACGSSSSANTNQGESSTPAEQPKQEIEPLTEIEVKQMYSNPKDFVGRRVELVGKVFSTPEYDKDGVYFQMWGDPAPDPKRSVRNRPGRWLHGTIRSGQPLRRHAGVYGKSRMLLHIRQFGSRII